MRIRKVNSVDVKLHDLTKVKLKTAGNTSVVQFADGNSKTCPMWITVTYKDVMTDGKQAFLDAKRFLRRLKRYLAKQSNFTDGQKSFQYITIEEPQGEKYGSSWHLYILLIFEDTAPFIANGMIANCGVMELHSRIKFLMQKD